LKEEKNQPVWQWLGVIIGITIVLLLTLPLLFCVGHHSSCCHSMQLHCVSCHCIVGYICIVPWKFLPCKGVPWHCSLGCGILLCSTSLHIMPQSCSLYCDIALCAIAFCFQKTCNFKCYLGLYVYHTKKTHTRSVAQDCLWWMEIIGYRSTWSKE